MKRSFVQLDSCIPAEILALEDDASNVLERCRGLELQLATSTLSISRKYHAMYCEPEILTKVLRVFVRHNLSLVENGASYTLNIEGGLLEPKRIQEHELGTLFSQVEVAIHTLRSTEPLTKFQWNSATTGKGRTAQCFQFKVPCGPTDTFIAKISLLKSSSIRARYELSAALREFLPEMPEESTEEDILLATWHFCVAHGLIEGKEKKQIRANNALKKLVGADVFSLASLRQRMKHHFLPLKPIQFDYLLAPDTSIDLAS